MPLPREEIDKKRKARSPYFMIREATQIEMKELKEAQFQLGNELREKCRPEIDSYVECCTDRVFSMFKACKQPAIDMRKCLKKVETKEYVDRRTREILEERLANGTSLVRATDRTFIQFYHFSLNLERFVMSSTICIFDICFVILIDNRFDV